MNNLLSLTLTVLILSSCSAKDNEAHNTSPSEKQQELQIKKDEHYPWTVDVMQAAVEAIHKSIRNFNKPEGQREKSFPADPFDFPFNQTEVQEYRITGYSHRQETPEIYQIDFKPVNDVKSGPRITVEINIKTKEAIRVFMQADA